MRILLSTLLCFFLGSVIVFGQAGDERLKEIREAAKKEIEEDGWVTGGGIGLDFAQLALINPRVGSGSNRIGFGGLATTYANYKKGKLAWNNSGSLQLAAQRIGGQGSAFEKNLDILRVISRVGYRAGESKFYAALEANAQTLLLPTYVGNTLTAPEEGANRIAQFLSPVQLVIAPGIEYKFDDHLSFFASPFGMKLIYVGNDSIAALNVHGNEEGSNSFLQLGANVRVGYNNTFLNDRLTWASNLDLYSNYLNDPQNLDVLWTNDLGITIFKGLSLNLVTELFYDDDVNVQIDRDGDGIFGEAIEDVDLTGPQKRAELAPSVSIVEGLFIKYNLIF
jgi:hypothetical protein